MKNAVLYLVLLFLSFRPGVIAQDFLDTVSYIPVVVTSWQDIDGDYRDGIPLIKAMGADAMVIANHSWNDLSIFNPMKILHYRHKQDAEPYDIVKYTDASYVVYEAEGTDTAHGRATLEVNSAIGFVPSGAYYAQTADTTRGYLILGPGVLQRMRYQDYFENQVQIDYQTDYILRLQNDSGYTLPDSLKICDLEITVRQKDSFYVMKPVKYKSITYRDFVDKGLNTWQPWDLSYRLDSLQFKMNPHLAPPIEETADSVKWSATYVEYRVKWHGVSGLTLSVDKIITSDQRGREIVTIPSIQNSVRAKAFAYKDRQNMLGWYGMEEPKFIDNYEPYRIVDSIVRAATGNTQFLHTSITPGELGKYWYGNDGSWKYSPIIEFAKRAKPHIMHLNLYHYHNPNGLNQPGYLNNNINWVILNLDSMALLNRRYGLDFGYAVYGGDSWSYDTLGNQTHVLYRPTTEQLLYTTYLGLLYGAKQIWIDPAFSYNVNGIPGKPGTRGLLDSTLGITSTYNTFKDTIIPLLHGEFGRTLKKMKAVIQFTGKWPGLNYSSETISYGFQYKSPELTPSRGNLYEFGVFNNPEKSYAKYLFVLKRISQQQQINSKITIKVLNIDAAYNNYLVRDLISGKRFISARTNDNCIVFTDSTSPGEGRLFEIVPVKLATGNRGFVTQESFTQDYTINSPDTVTVSQGVILTFSNSSSLLNHGMLKLQGAPQQPVILDFVQQTTNNGLYNDGSLQIRNAHIKRAANGIVNNDGNVLIDSSFFYINNTGLVINHSDEALTRTDVTNSEFSQNNFGIISSQAKGTIINNKFYSNSYGAVLTNSTVMSFGDTVVHGNNCIYDNGIGMVIDGSMPILGSEWQFWVGGRNSITNNGDYDCMILNNSYVLAENNFWGTRMILVDNTSTASFLPEYPIDPCFQGGNSFLVKGEKEVQKSKQNGLESNEDDIIKQAYSLIQGPGFREGIQLCKQVIEANPDTSIAAPALMLLSLAEQKHQLNELKPYLQLLSASTTENRVRFVADMLLANDSNGNTRSRIELLLEKYVDTDIREEIHFSILREYLFTERDTIGARGILRMMKERYNGQLTILAGIMMDGKKTPGGVSKPMNTEDGTTIPVEYQLKGNYPNPFNPETVIEYGIPEAAEVTLEVYDIMGRLMNRETKNLQAGYHFYTWNGKEAASGVYLYRIMMKSQKDRKVRTFSSKMMLLR